MAGLDFDPKTWLSNQPQIDILDHQPFDPWRLKIKSSEEFTTLTPGEKLAYLAWFGSLSPSTHNTVPARFSLIPERSSITTSLDRTTVLAFSDPKGRQASISLGCTIANIELAAQSYGLNPVTNFLPGLGSVDVQYQSEYPNKLASVSTTQFGPEVTADIDLSLLQAILSRKMVRTRFDEAVKLPPETANRLRLIAKDSDLGLHLMTDSLTKGVLAKFQEKADNFVFNNPDFSYELGKYLLPNSNNTQDFAMRGREFNLTDEYALEIHQGLLGQTRLSAADIADFSRVSGDGIRRASAIGIITVDTDEVDQWLKAGMAYERMAITLRQEGFFTAMHAGITEVDFVNLGFRMFLRDARRPTVVFRIGKPTDPKDLEIPHSARPGIDKLIVTNPT